MSTILVLCVLAAAAWLALSLVARSTDSGPRSSVDDFSKALSALATPPGPERSARPTRRRSPRPAAARRSTQRPAANRTRDPMSSR